MRRRTFPVMVSTLAAIGLLGFGVQAASAADPAPAAVSVPGSFGAEAGCAGGDWAPDCDQLQMRQRANDDVWSITVTLPKGQYEFKVALNKSWDTSYGQPGTGGNIPLTVAADNTPVTFFYDQTTHFVATSLDGPVYTAAGSFQSELGCPGDWAPDCLRSWLQDPDGDGTATFTTVDLPAGSYETKVASDQSWDTPNWGMDGSPGGANIPFTVAKDGEATTFSFDEQSHVLSVFAGAGLPSLKRLAGYWLGRDVIAWQARSGADAASYRLFTSGSGGLKVTPTGITGGTSYPLTLDAGGLPASLRATFPAQAQLPALRLDASTAAKAADLLKGQVAVAAFDETGRLVDATGLQTPGVLDDIDAAATKAALGLTYRGATPSLALWAPTAQRVSLQVFDGPTVATPSSTYALSEGTAGVWTVTGKASWTNKYFLYDVQVFVPETGKVEHNLVTDPYSVGLSTNSTRSLFVDLEDPKLAPSGWGALGLIKPSLPQAVDQSITELHVRDFSIGDPTVPAQDRGTYRAFGDRDSNAVKHLRALSKAGLTTVHLLPTADFASRSVDEVKANQASPTCDLASYAPDSDQQQACTGAVAAQDGYNWGYDPQHYAVPEGSYATDPDGTTRISEYRGMVSDLNREGLRVVMDVVYNHTADAGQNGTNDLDRIVPGYYHRLDATGATTTSTCCPDTATEHTMMGKLLIDSVTSWAIRYKVDGFRFDLMNFTPKQVMQQLRTRLDQLTLARDGIDGKRVYVYGEGWDFGTVANDALFPEARQVNMAGTGIGTFNDRLRDAVRGGRFDDTDPRRQGWASGLSTAPNGAAINGTTAQQLQALGLAEDQIKVALTGNLRDYTFTDHTGKTVKGSQVDYNGAPAGYTAQPQEAVNYVDAHDNETLFDYLTYKLPQSTSMADRIRLQTLALATTALSQGVSFWQAGSEALRSKSFDGNSYNSGDWINELDPSLTSNGFGKGLPPSAESMTRWQYAKPLLADPKLKPAPADLRTAESQSETLLRLRRSSPLLHLGSARLIEQKVSFPVGGPTATPGVIVERIDDTVGQDADPLRKGQVIIFNAGTTSTTQTLPGLKNQRLILNPVQLAGPDPVVRTARFDRATGAFTVPARTVAVFDQF